MALKVGDVVPLPPGAFLPDGTPNPAVFKPKATGQLPAIVPGVTMPGSSYGVTGNIFDGYGIGMQPNGSTRSDGSGVGSSKGWTDYLKDLGTYAGRELLDATINKVLGPTSEAAGGGTPAGGVAVTGQTTPGVYYTTAPAQAGGISASTLMVLAVVGLGAVLIAKAVK